MLRAGGVGHPDPGGRARSFGDGGAGGGGPLRRPHGGHLRARGPLRRSVGRVFTLFFEHPRHRRRGDLAEKVPARDGAGTHHGDTSLPTPVPADSVIEGLAPAPGVHHRGLAHPDRRQRLFLADRGPGMGPFPEHLGPSHYMAIGSTSRGGGSTRFRDLEERTFPDHAGTGVGDNGVRGSAFGERPWWCSRYS